MMKKGNGKVGEEEAKGECDASRWGAKTMDKIGT